MANQLLQDIHKALGQVKYPGFSKSIVDFNFVKSCELEKGKTLRLLLEIPASNPQVSEALKAELMEKLAHLKLDALNLSIKQPEEPQTPFPDAASEGKNLAPQIKHFVMVSSGKGGVGKSTTSLNLAIAMSRLGQRVGLLDADIYGPNLPRMMGLADERPLVKDAKLEPLKAFGIEFMSMGNLIEPGQGLMWRGAMIMKAIAQLLQDVMWSPLDVLFIDMPPGTGDAQITLAQSVPVGAGVVVSTPQGVSLDDSRRALDMFEKLNIKVAGLIENMSSFIAPDTGVEYQIFGKGGALSLAHEYDVDVLAAMPIDINLREAGDSGRPLTFYEPTHAISARYYEAAGKLLDFLEVHAKDVDNASVQPIPGYRPE